MQPLETYAYFWLLELFVTLRLSLFKSELLKDKYKKYS